MTTRKSTHSTTYPRYSKSSQPPTGNKHETSGHRAIERFLRYDEEVRELTIRLADMRKKRQKYHDKLVRLPDSDLVAVGMQRHTFKQYQPLTQRFLRASLEDYFKKEGGNDGKPHGKHNGINGSEMAERCMAFILKQRRHFKRERIDISQTT